MDAKRLQLAAQIAQGAGQLLLRYFRAKNLQNNLKIDSSLVTEADIAADNYISESIQKFFPGEVILSEEFATTPAISQANKHSLWVVDPLDGTTNFFLGLPIWGVSIAHLVDGEPETGVLFFPLLNEIYTAQSAQGAYFNGERLEIADPDPERPYSFFSCCTRTYRRYQVSIPYKTRILGSAAYTLCCVAKGSAILGFEATPKIWDLSAAWLLVLEAGGVVETLDGSQPFPVCSEINYAQISYPTIAAASPLLAARAHRQIIPQTSQADN